MILPIRSINGPFCIGRDPHRIKRNRIGWVIFPNLKQLASRGDLVYIVVVWNVKIALRIKSDKTYGRAYICGYTDVLCFIPCRNRVSIWMKVCE